MMIMNTRWIHAFTGFLLYCCFYLAGVMGVFLLFPYYYYSYSDIWRNYPKVMQYLYRLFYLSSKQGSTTSVAACVLEDLDPSTIYLQPYLLPAPAAKKKKPPFPLFEMLGAYVGYVETVPRLPQDGGLEACQSLFQVCEELTGCKYDDVATNRTT